MGRRGPESQREGGTRSPHEVRHCLGRKGRGSWPDDSSLQEIHRRTHGERETMVFLDSYPGPYGCHCFSDEASGNIRSGQSVLSKPGKKQGPGKITGESSKPALFPKCPRLYAEMGIGRVRVRSPAWTKSDSPETVGPRIPFPISRNRSGVTAYSKPMEPSDMISRGALKACLREAVE